MSVAAIATEIKKRISAKRLVQLTNDDPGVTTINEVVLNAAASDAIGDFERLAKIIHDSSSPAQISVLCSGTLYYLEKYKGRESAVVNEHKKEFYAACQHFGSLIYAPTLTNSLLVPEKKRSGERADMDRDRSIWRRSGSLQPQIKEWEQP